MGSIKFKIHPLFWVVLLVETTLGNLFEFVIYTVTAVIHELGHSVCALERGYSLKNIVFAPFGAIVTGCKEFDIKDQTAIALSGPLINFLVGITVVGLWWFYPESYAYTDIIAKANFSIAIVNLLPSYPLDGGRILSALLSKKFTEKTANTICKCVGATLGLILLVIFFLTIKSGINVSLLLFSTFMIFGALSAKQENSYTKLFLSFNEKKLIRGMPYKKFALSSSARVKSLIKLLDQSAINEVVVYKNGKIVKILDQNGIENLILRARYTEKIEKYLQ